MFLHLGAVDEDGREVAKVVWRAVIMEKRMMCMAGRDNNIFLVRINNMIYITQYMYDSLSDVPESQVCFASKNLTPCRMH